MSPTSSPIRMVGGPFHNRYAEATPDFELGVALHVKHTSSYALYSWAPDDETYVFDGVVKKPELIDVPDDPPAEKPPKKRGPYRKTIASGKRRV